MRNSSSYLVYFGSGERVGSEYIFNKHHLRLTLFGLA